MCKNVLLINLIDDMAMLPGRLSQYRFNLKIDYQSSKIYIRKAEK